MAPKKGKGEKPGKEDDENKEDKNDDEKKRENGKLEPGWEKYRDVHMPWYRREYQPEGGTNALKFHPFWKEHMRPDWVALDPRLQNCTTKREKPRRKKK